MKGSRASRFVVYFIASFWGVLIERPRDIAAKKEDIATTSSYRHMASTTVIHGSTLSLDDIAMMINGAVGKTTTQVGTSTTPITETPQIKLVSGLYTNAVDVQLPYMLKFHVSGQIDARYAAELTNYNFPEKLKDFSTILDAQLTKLFKSEEVYAVHMEQIRDNGAFVAFSATIYFEPVTKVDVALIRQLIRDDKDFKASDVYVFEYCTKNTCNHKNGQCVLQQGSAVCRCKPGFQEDRCKPRMYSVKDYYLTGGLCGVTFAIIVALLVVFCRTYKFPQRRETTLKSHASSVRTGNSSNINSYQFSSYLKRGSNQATYVKRPDQLTALPTYKNMGGVIPLNGLIANGINNKAFAVENAETNACESIYKKQLKKFFEEAPQMRLNNANSFNENDKLGTKKQINSPNNQKSPGGTPMNVNDGKGNNIRSPPSGGSR